MADDTRASPEIIAMLRQPGVGERLFLGLLGPAYTRITLPYDDGVLKQNVAYHALAVIKERNDTRASIADLEKIIINFEESAAKQEAEIEILKLWVKEYKSKMNDVLKDRDQLRQKAKEANTNLVKVTKSRDAARARVEELTGAQTRTRQLYDQAEAQAKQIQKDCEMDGVLQGTKMEESSRKRSAVASDELQLKEDSRNKKRKMRKEDGMTMLMPHLNIGLNKQAKKAKDVVPSTFWTKSDHCKMRYEYLRVYINRYLRCKNCRNELMLA